MKVRLGCVVVGFLSLVLSLAAQTPGSNPASAEVPPPLMNFSGVLTDVSSKPLTGVVGVTFSLYQEQQGGSPLWLETQNVKPNSTGHYTVVLGSATSQGIPANLFASGEARWLGVQVQGQPEQPRVLLVSAPYALKAGDAETLGGKPASAFMAASGNAASGNNVIANTVTGTGTPDYVPLWLTKSKLGSSKLFQSTAGGLGIGTTAPAASLDVNGTSDIRNTLTLFPNGSAPTLSINGTAFSISKTGTVSFVSGQTFPGTGTVTSVASGAGLTGGPITKSGTLSVATGGVTNAMLQNSSLTVTANSPLSGGGAVSLGGSTSLGLKSCSANQILEFVSGAWACANPGTGTVTSVGTGLGLKGGPITTSGTLTIDTTVVPQLAAANTFTGNQTVNGALAAQSSGNTIIGNSTGASATGVLGEAESTSGFGVYGTSPYIGVDGYASATSGTTVGVYGSSESASGFGVEGASSGGGPGVGVHGVEGGGSGNGIGAGGAGVWGDTGGRSGVYSGVLGTADDNWAGAFSNAGSESPTIYAENNETNLGGQVFQGYVAELSTSASIGDPGCNTGFIALQLGQEGMSGCNNYTLAGGNNGDTYINAVTGGAVHIRINSVEQLEATSGNVNVYGNLTVSGNKNFRIDHPLDPANKYLFHAAIESSEVLNLYSGNAILDDSGEAVVQLPDWFEVINKDFRYQLTTIGGFAPVYISEEVSGGHFKIAGGAPGGKVSWQVSGVRNDAWEKAHPMVVEADKGARRGQYLTPELYGAPETTRIGYMTPAPGSEQIVHPRPPIHKRGNASPLQQRTPLSLPIPPMPVASKVAQVLKPAAQASKLEVNQK